MHPRIRAVLLAGAALVALAPSSGAAALAAHSVPAMSHAAGDQGLTWGVVPSPNRKANPPENQLFGVTCLSATSCTAVGYGAKKDLGNTLVERKTLVERWNGTAWSIVPSPNRPGLDELQGISCVSASACTAVGWSAASPASGSSYRTLIETWNGTAWSIVPSPNPGTGQGHFLYSVSCVTAAFCAAVGHYGPSGSAKPITEIRNGSTWSVAPNPQKLHDADLTSVSCVSATACTAVGSHLRVSPPAMRTLVESWNGSSWSVVPSPDAGTDDNNSLAGVSCTSTTACTAVGSYFDAGLGLPAEQTLVESWNGSSWSVVPSPDIGTGASNWLHSVSCASPKSCIAVGIAARGETTDSVTLIEAWNGTSWSALPSLVTKNIGTILNGVSCPSASMCMAAGTRYATQDSPPRTLTVLGTSSG